MTTTVLQIPGPVGSGGALKESPAGDIDGVNTDYTTTYTYTLGTTQVFLNGLLQQDALDYQEMGSNVLRFLDAPFTGDVVLVVYEPEV